jgi:hypothetical protein
MGAEREDFALLNHFTILVYPFAHNITEANQKTKLQSLAPVWDPWWSRLDEDKVGKAIDDTYFFLPYIRELLFPETSLFTEVPGQQYSSWIATIKEINKKGIVYLAAELPPRSNLRLTYKGGLVSRFANFKVFEQTPTGEQVEEPAGLLVRLEWIDCMLFASGIGFLLLKIRVDETPAKLSQLIDLNYYLRTVHPPTVPWTLPTLRFDNGSTSVTVRDFLDYLLQGMTASQDSITTDISGFINDLRQSKQNRFTDTEFGQVYGERCQILSYACIGVDVADKDKKAAGPFGSDLDRLLYEFASCTALGDSVSQAMWIPSQETVEALTRNKISVWRSWRGMAFKESVVFLATEDIPFNKKGFPDNIECDYLPLYLYTLHQKFQLFMFSSDLMRKGAQIDRNLKKVRDLMARFVVFRNRYWFNEITRKPLGGDLYQKFQEGLGVTTLYDLVCGEAKDMEEYYEQSHEKRIGFLINLFTFVFVPLGAVIGVFGMTFFNGSWKQFTISCILVGIASLALWKWRTRE